MLQMEADASWRHLKVMQHDFGQLPAVMFQTQAAGCLRCLLWSSCSPGRETEAQREGREPGKLYLSFVFTSYLDTIGLRCSAVMTQAQH